MKEITSYNEYYNIISTSKQFVVVDFTAKWCGPCQRMLPMIQQLERQYSNVVFLKIDVDNAKDIATKENISSMPTFKFYKNGQKIHEFSGASIQLLIQTIQLNA